MVRAVTLLRTIGKGVNPSLHLSEEEEQYEDHGDQRSSFCCD